jgi:hypothetical protein
MVGDDRNTAAGKERINLHVGKEVPGKESEEKVGIFPRSFTLAFKSRSGSFDVVVACNK